MVNSTKELKLNSSSKTMKQKMKELNIPLNFSSTKGKHVEGNYKGRHNAVKQRKQRKIMVGGPRVSQNRKK